MSFECNYEQLKQLAKDFHDSIKGATLEELDGGFKCFSVHYLSFKPAHSHEIAGAAALMRIMGRSYMDAEYSLGVRTLNGPALARSESSMLEAEPH